LVLFLDLEDEVVDDSTGSVLLRRVGGNFAACSGDSTNNSGATGC